MRKIFQKIHSVKSLRHYKVILLGTLVCAYFISACQWVDDQPISVAAHVWLGYEPMFLARNEGWLDKKQVQLLETRSATESIQALMDKKVDAAALTLDETLKVRAMGLPLTVVMVFNTSAGADMLVAEQSIKKLSDLKGKRLAFEGSSLSDVMLVHALHQAQLTMQDVKLVKLNVDQHYSAWQAGQADAFITYEPVATLLLADGAQRLFDTRQIPNTIVDVLVVRQDKLDWRHSKALTHLVSTHFRALSHLRYNPQDAAYRMAEHLQIDAQNVLGAYKGLLLPDTENNYRLLDGENAPLLISARKLTELMLEHSLIKKSDDLKSLITAQYLPKDFDKANE